MKPRLLVVDDDETLCAYFSAILTSADYEVETASTGEAAAEQLRSKRYDVLLTDLAMSGMDGLALAKIAAEIHPTMPVIVVTGAGDLRTAVESMRAGVSDFIVKPVDADVLVHQVGRAARQGALEQRVVDLESELRRVNERHGMLGESGRMKQVRSLIDRVSRSDVNVLITGESGTGKELAARAIHDASPRESGPFVALNCAAIPATLIESELFGHVKGAFTDARKDRDGLLVQAQGGTLFLDELGEMPLEMQPKLLRALQERRVRPVGGASEKPFDARIVTATNRDLEDEVEAGNFREDLLYRVDVVRLELPPLRARGRDVLLLAQHFLGKYEHLGQQTISRLSPAAASALLHYDWPGNVRELENCMERAMALARDEEIALEDLPRKVREYERDRVSVDDDDDDELLTLDQLEARYIRKVMKVVEGNKSKAARVLGLDRRSLYRRLEKYEVEAT
ncbi:MAG: sigma-54-dependent transcriptional regulator [Nannocystaceae bacterium]|nr:sigma-54 dependent transcriptional regulator [bacterium]